jgi:hypothetical protein
MQTARIFPRAGLVRAMLIHKLGAPPAAIVRILHWQNYHYQC